MPLPSRLLRLPTLSFVAMLIAVSPAQAEFTGADWLASSADMKEGVVLGTLAVIDIERDFRRADTSCASAEPTLLGGLGHLRAPQLQQALERYYKQHPDRRDRAIADAIWAVAEQQMNKR
jgi:hypothetical protein